MNILLIILIIIVIMDLGVNIFVNIISNNNAGLLVNLTTQINQERERNNKIINEYKEYIKLLDMKCQELTEALAKYEHKDEQLY